MVSVKLDSGLVQKKPQNLKDKESGAIKEIDKLLEEAENESDSD